MFFPCNINLVQQLGVKETVKQQEILNHEDLDWTSIVTPINVEALQTLLKQTNYNRRKSKFLIQGFQQGFDIGYRGKTNRRDTANNLPLGEVGTNIDLWNKVMQEVGAKRFAGPFSEHNFPFDNFIQSPLGLVPKDNGKQTRLIFHLSYDFKHLGNPSVNSCIPEAWCKVKYRNLD